MSNHAVFIGSPASAGLDDVHATPGAIVDQRSPEWFTEQVG
jgi:hypothetical protein